MEVSDRDFRAGASGKAGVEELGTFLREREKTKRLLICVAALLFVVAAFVLVFSPSGKETMAYIIGAALIIFALGAIGAATFKIKFPGIEIETGMKTGSQIHESEPPAEKGEKAL